MTKGGGGVQSMDEWSKAQDWFRASVSLEAWVQIPPPPPIFLVKDFLSFLSISTRRHFLTCPARENAYSTKTEKLTS